jgi:hypothetical protein
MNARNENKLTIYGPVKRDLREGNRVVSKEIQTMVERKERKRGIDMGSDGGNKREKGPRKTSSIGI